MTRERISLKDGPERKAGALAQAKRQMKKKEGIKNKRRGVKRKNKKHLTVGSEKKNKMHNIKSVVDL